MLSTAREVLANQFRLVVVGIIAFAAIWSLLVGHHAERIPSSGVLAWWTALCALSIFNVCGWRLSAAAVARHKPATHPAVHLLQQRQLLLSAVYVIGCGFRSILPRADVQRIGLFDSWMSSVLVGRSVATIAELCFVAQWALLLHRVGTDAKAPLAVAVSWILVPLILVAEMCSWFAVLTTSYLGNAIEESIWTLSAILLTVSCLTLWSRCRRVWRPFLGAALVLGVAYIAFMCSVDVPMYANRWLADEANGRQYLSLGQGFWDVWARMHVTFDWEQWRTEIPWMTLYFSVCVWFSIALVHAPRLDPRPQLES